VRLYKILHREIYLSNYKIKTIMKKTHSSPEFTVIKQNQANAKFFVASGGAPGFTGNPSSTGTPPVPSNSASNYDNGGDINM